MSTLTSNGNNERVSDARLAELVSHYQKADQQHNGWWIALYWCLRELQERRSNESGEQQACWACLSLYTGPRSAGGKCPQCASGGSDPVRAVAWLGFPADQPKPDYDVAYDDASKLPGHSYTAIYWQPPAQKALEQREVTK